MGIKATDKNRNLFLKGFKLSDSGSNEDPTYLGFKIIFDFGVLPINPNYGWAPSPILRDKNYTSQQGASMATMKNPFGQAQYTISNPEVTYYSAYNYLLQRDGVFNGINSNTTANNKRANALLQFQKLLRDINTNSPWFFQSIEGLDKLDKVEKSGFQTSNDIDHFDIQRTGEKFLTINTLESLNLRMNALQDLYNQATFDADNMRWLVPRNLRKFTMWIMVTEIRNFFKTSRLTGASTTLSAINDLSSLISTDRNPGGAIVENYIDSSPQGSTKNGASQNAFSSFANGVFNKSGLSNEKDALSNQSDQSGIKPLLIYECSQCEFDFSNSTSLKSIIDIGAESATPEVNSFKIHVGKVRIKNQYPNIRADKKPLILADGYTQSQSSVQSLESTLDVEEIASAGKELLTNFVSGAVSDLINEGISQFISPALGGLDQSLMGNIYSMDPSQLTKVTSGKGLFNNAANYLDGASETGIDNIFKGNLPNPQTMGEGGPPERVYPPISKDGGDVYPNVPGRDLGVKERVYSKPKDDVYKDVPGKDLGVPDRVYPEVRDDVYEGVPGKDLGVPDRIYNKPRGDAYDKVPGSDLGVPDRVYPKPQGDVYPNVPGIDLGVPDRVYPETTGDVYLDVPGTDLGVPDRVYPDVNDDVYDNVPGSDLGVPDRVYPVVNDDVYDDVILTDKLDNETIYDKGQPSDKLANETIYDKGQPSDKLEKETIYDKDIPNNKLEKEVVYEAEKIITKPLLDKVYIDPTSTETTNMDTVYPKGKIIESRGELRSPESNFETKPEKVYHPESKGNRTPGLGGIYPETSGDFIVEQPLNLGNLKSSSKFNPSLGTHNPEEYEEQ